MRKLNEFIRYKGHYLSVYKYEEPGHVGDDFEIKVHHNSGLDEPIDCSVARYVDHCESQSAAIAIGKAFVTGIFEERANRQNKL